MTLQQIANAVAAMLGTTSSAFTINGVDMFLQVVNDAVRQAQLRNNFEDCRIGALVQINGIQWTPLSSATIVRGVATAGIREVVAVQRQRPDGTWIPLDFARIDIPIERDRTELEFSDNLFPYLRYPSDAQINARGTNSSIIQSGSNLGIYPRFNLAPNVYPTFYIHLEGFGWMTEYVSGDYNTANPDWIVQYCGAWLRYAAAYDLNGIFKTYVGRVEGNISDSALKEMRDSAWRDVLINDQYKVDANTTRSR